MSLRRVPPNLLVGPGATDFAAELGVQIVHPDLLVSPAAGERYDRWKADLHKVETTSESESEIPDHPNYLVKDHEHSRVGPPDSHLDLVPCWNESQPHTPKLTPSETLVPIVGQDSFNHEDEAANTPSWSNGEPGHDGLVRDQANHAASVHDVAEEGNFDTHKRTKSSKDTGLSRKRPLKADSPPPKGMFKQPESPKAPPPTRSDSPHSLREFKLCSSEVISKISRPDDITDTVGAIAIDCFGNIAAGSSSGGIGMKHRGRVGPAALVGIGTAVVPIEPKDEEKLCVATVISGTGEHMATTMAAGSCASRLYTTTRRGRGGASEPADGDDEVIQSFVEKDFMGESRDLSSISRSD